MLTIENLHVRVGDREILKGLTLDGAGRRSARHHGPERLRQEHARAGPRRPRGLRRHGRPRSCIDGQDLLALAPEERARAGVFLAFQYPIEIPGVNNAYLLKAALNAQRAGARRAADRRFRVHEIDQEQDGTR